MGTLSQTGIQQYLRKPQIRERLIVTPLLDPNQTIGTSAIDVRLGNQFVTFRREALASVDLKSIKGKPTTAVHQRVIVEFGKEFILHPGQLALGSTLEYVQIPAGLMCYAIGKSTWGRAGLIIATATKVDAGFKGVITLELLNEGEVPICLYPGIPIAQLVLHESESAEMSHLKSSPLQHPPIQRDEYHGKYSYPIGPQFPIFKDDADARFWTEQVGKLLGSM